MKENNKYIILKGSKDTSHLYHSIDAIDKYLRLEKREEGLNKGKFYHYTNIKVYVYEIENVIIAYSKQNNFKKLKND